MVKSLDRKLAAILANPDCREFILADAKDADMALGLGAPGKSPELHAGEVRFKTLEEYRDQMRLITRQGLVDIMLMSASSNYALTFGERLFDGSAVTPAIRANDTTDIHLARGSSYAAEPALPFRTASLDHAMCGHLDCKPEERTLGSNLGLYSVTFNNDLRRDLETLERFHAFREEAERKGFRYFLEVFDPNVATGLAPDVLPFYLNDMITRMLAGVAPAGRPVFLKIVYHGPKAMEELVRFDRKLVVGILGGSSGTTRDAFQLLHDAQKHGAKVALFGRKINHAENQLAFVQFLRLIVDGVIQPVDAVKAYHAVLGKLGVAPHRPLEDDLKVTEQSMSYAGGKSVTVPPPQAAPAAAPTAAPSLFAAKPSTNGFHATNGSAGTNGDGFHAPARPLVTESRSTRETRNGVSAAAEAPDGRPDFARMSPSDRLAYHRDRLGLGR
ncbi:hypothetical protein [Paludisphaera mucosa]|uniref:Fructose-bisphosphate aldolase n=1 Tax=Paludisphaera mucosa TaxID=3030827 RepID=A0ABT6FA99_9BACT|nr:hypothetical protein [Paludisphaera mucosa]MDG3004522.1 hypothetical protein [Paludisphaera mucosa]